MCVYSKRTDQQQKPHQMFCCYKMILSEIAFHLERINQMCAPHTQSFLCLSQQEKETSYNKTNYKYMIKFVSYYSDTHCTWQSTLINILHVTISQSTRSIRSTILDTTALRSSYLFFYHIYGFVEASCLSFQPQYTAHIRFCHVYRHTWTAGK